jgi:hypothetical protein
MIEPPTLPLAPKLNATNVLDDSENLESTSETIDQGYALQGTSSVTKMLAELAHFSLEDENIPPNKVVRSFATNHNLTVEHIESSNDVGALKAELEATRRKLAEYEANSVPFLQKSIPIECTTSTRLPFSSEHTPLGFSQTDTSPWSDYDSSSSVLPRPPRPSPRDFPATVPLLHLPPTASVPFQLSNTATNINPCLIPDNPANI